MNIFLTIVASFGIGGVIGTVIQQVLTNWHDSRIRKFDAKQTAFSNAVTVISGVGHASIYRLISAKPGEVDEIDVVKYRSEVRRGLAGAALVGSSDLRQKIGEIDNLLLQLKEMVQKMFSDETSVSEEDFIAKRDEILRWEDDVIALMRKELGF